MKAEIDGARDAALSNGARDAALSNGARDAALSTGGRDAASSTNRTAIAALAELVSASLLWGFGFIATIWGMKELGPFTLTTMRFVVAVTASAPFILALPTLRRHFNLSQLKLALLPGLFLASTLVLQTWGLRYTSVAKSSFITTLYVVIVPILERLLLHRRLHHLHWVFVGVALFGMALICGLKETNWNIGDLLTLFSAIAAGLQITWFGRINTRINSPAVFNFCQSVCSGALCLPLLFFETSPLLPTQPIAWAGLLSLSFGSTMFAFMLQIKAQKHLSPSVASLVYLLESPFATLFAIGILGQTLAPQQWIGAALILIASAAASIYSLEEIKT